MMISCECTLFSTTTMMEGVLDAFETSSIDEIFSPASLDALANLAFWEYAIFYVAIIMTVMAFLAVVYGAHLDRNDLIALVEEEIKDLPRDKEILAIERKIKGLKVEVEDMQEEQILERPEDFANANVANANRIKLAAASLAGG